MPEAECKKPHAQTRSLMLEPDRRLSLVFAELPVMAAVRASAQNDSLWARLSGKLSLRRLKAAVGPKPCTFKKVFGVSANARARSTIVV